MIRFCKQSDLADRHGMAADYLVIYFFVSVSV